MSTGVFRWDRARPDVGLRGLLEGGVLAEGVVLTAPEGVEVPVPVRPVIAEAGDDWAAPIERAVAPSGRGRVAVVSERPALAAAVAVELAVRLGDRGRRVVLIDGSLDDPTLAKALPDDGDEGLVDVVLFGVSGAAGMRRTLAPGVSLITAGSLPLSSADVFASDGFGALMTNLSERAAIVLALPLSHLEAAAHALDSVVAVGASARELRSIADRAGGRTVAGVVAGPSAAPPGADEPAAARPAPPEGAAARPEASGAEERALPGPDAVAAEGGAPTGEVAAAPVPDEAERAPGGRVLAPRDARDGALGAWRREAAGVFVTAATARARPRRRRRAPAVIVTVAAAVVAAWVGTRIVRGGRELDPNGREARPSSRLAERPVGVEEGGPGDVGVGEAGRVDGGPADRAPADGAPSDRDTPAEGAPREAPADEPAEVTPGTIAGPGGPYAVFVSSHRYASDASVEAEELARRGVSVTIVPTEVGETGVWHRVAVSGGYPRIAAARAALGRIHELGYGGAWIERSRSSP